MGKSRVAIVKTRKNPGEREIGNKVREAINAIGGMTRFIKQGDLVIVKPNLVISMAANTGATTDWRISKAVVDLVREQGGHAVIGESCGTGGDTEKVFKTTGYDILRDQGYEVIDFKKIENIEVSAPNAKIIKQFMIPVLVKQADVIINLPKIKTHDQLLMSGALKNSKGGLAEKEKNRLHREGLSQGIADINAILRPKLVVVDGIVGQQGLGPVFGEPVEMNLIIAGDDPVAVDTVLCHIMEIQPDDVPCIKFAQEMGIGTMAMERIQIYGKEISQVKRRFRLPEEDIKKIQIPGFRMIFSEKSCTGCRNTMYSVIKDMETKGLMDALNGLTVLVGEAESIPEDLDIKNLVLVGACTAKNRAEGIRYAPGCPPRNYWVIEAITGVAQQARTTDLRQKIEK
jgi:uncharacterized protein (DUF362 family)